MDDALVDRLDNAATRVEAIMNPGGSDIDEAYAVQEALVARRLIRGEAQLGWKLGFTSLAKMAQMGISDVIVGRLTSGMSVPDGGDLRCSRFIHPRVEPEVAFRLSRDLEDDEDLRDIVGAVDAVAPALEIIDSRYRDFQFTLADVVADNTSAAAFAIGDWLPIDSVAELGGRAVSLSLNGATVQTGSTDAILGHPMRAITALGDMAARRGLPLLAGQVILAGAATSAVRVSPGEIVRGVVDGLGSVTIRVVT